MVTGWLVVVTLAMPPAPNPEVRTPGASAAHKDAVARFGAAVWNVRRDRLLTAARQLESAARQDPDATAPLRELVRIYSQLGREPDAIRVAREVIRKDPQDVETAHALARLLFDAGELKEAVAAAKIAADAPLTADRADKAVAVYRDLATLCEKANDPATAETALRKALTWLTEKRKEVIAAGAFTPKEADTAAAECLERLGKVQTKLANYADAAESFTAAAKLYTEKANDPASAARLNWNLSGVLQAKGEPLAALETLEKFLKLKPVAVEPYTRYAAIMRETGRRGTPYKVLERLAEADPKNLPLQAAVAAEKERDFPLDPDVTRRFAKLMAETNDPKIVEVMVRAYLTRQRAREIVAILNHSFTVLTDKDGKDPKDETPVTAAARAFAAEKAHVIGDILRADSKAAMIVLKAAAEDARFGTKRTHQVHYFLGQLAARHRQLELAAVHFREAVQYAARETVGDAYTGLIDVLLLSRKPAELAAVCRQGLQNAQDISPHFFNYYLAQALAELGDEKGAIAAVDKAIETTAVSDKLTVRLQKVFVLRLLGRWDDAVALGKELLTESDAPADRLRVRFTLAGAYWGAKKSTEAEAELRAVLDAEPENAPACNDLGFHLADAGRNLDEAERLIRTAIASDKLDRKKAGSAELENAAYIDSLGWVLFRQGKMADARTELERAAALPSGESDPVVWDHLGDVLFRLGEKAKAKEAWEKAAGLYEADARASSRGRRDGRLDEVKRKLKRVP